MNMIDAQPIERASVNGMKEKTSSVHSEIARYDSLLMQLSDAVDSYESKVILVSMNDEGTEDSNRLAMPSAPMNSSVANSIWQNNERLYNILSRIDRITSRIDL